MAALGDITVLIQVEISLLGYLLFLVWFKELVCSILDSEWSFKFFEGAYQICVENRRELSQSWWVIIVVFHQSRWLSHNCFLRHYFDWDFCGGTLTNFAMFDYASQGKLYLQKLPFERAGKSHGQKILICSELIIHLRIVVFSLWYWMKFNRLSGAGRMADNL